MAKKIIYTEDAPDPIGPYSQAVFVNNTLYISGQIAIDPFSESLILSDIESETKQVMKNIGFILDAAEMDFSNVVKCSIFLKDMNDFPKVNAIYGSYFKENPPARETVQVAKLPRNVNVEISTIAVR
ncbi:MAG: RidA family protein [Bacteroidetes bacterium]|jgi:2-iminobutanoate/2-iminopropanoate deaminase|nr:RidA family protein [Bacteroidota bacterium]MBP7256262.1 RidA family protein [Chitinophagales bacterium]MBK7139278.1 RidA family protein [Bacteroidota bacterium]MBK7503843.1 RidA family protein [Bacteroidota bacterium]MBK7640604.1 RidA family protein [Bacteroidota bacterium]